MNWYTSANSMAAWGLKEIQFPVKMMPYVSNNAQKDVLINANLEQDGAQALFAHGRGQVYTMVVSKKKIIIIKKEEKSLPSV